MTLQELQERQAWSFDQKLDHAVATVENFYSRLHGRVFVSFSGGKDSTVLLDLCRRFVDKLSGCCSKNVGKPANIVGGICRHKEENNN